MIRAVIFDWGGVIQRTLERRPRRELAAELGLSTQDLEHAVFDSEMWQRASIGEVDADAAWAAMAGALGWPGHRVDDLVERFFAGDRLDARLISLVRHLRAEGLRVVLLSNALPPRSTGGTAGRWGLDGLFDTQVFSYEVGHLKPHPAMYRAALEATGVAADEALFVDDVEANVQGARAVGLHAVRFVGTDALLGSMRDLGLPAMCQ